jgi:hypothetical protein
MGAKHGNKKGKVDSALTVQHIGEPNCKCAADSDPYGASEQSGKYAKPDARFSAANARAHAAAKWAVPKAEPPPTSLPPPMLPPPTLPLPMLLPPVPLHASHYLYTYNPYYYPPLSQPVYPHSQGLTPYRSTYSHPPM